MRPLQTYLVIKRRQQRATWRRISFQRQARRLSWGLGAFLGLAIAGLVLASVLAYANLTRDLPSPAQIPALLDPPNGILLQPTRIYDRTGQHLLVSLDNDQAGSREYISIDATVPNHIPHILVQAVLASADPNFWNHPGFSWSDLTSSQISTLAESLVSDLLLADEPPSLARNIRVRILAAQITAVYGRDKVLEWYLNSANFGHLAYGIEAAAQLYLGKPASQLNLAESALLAAAAQAPALNPIDAPVDALTHQRQAIEAMLQEGMITQEQADQALVFHLDLQKAPATHENPALAFTTLVENDVARLVGRATLERGGLVIRTTLDYDLQLQLVCMLQTQLLRVSSKSPEAVVPSPGSDSEGNCAAARLLPTLSLENQANLDYLEASGLVVDPQTGQVLAMVGDTSITGEESPVLSAHPTGSLLTPFIYLAGFTRGMVREAWSGIFLPVYLRP